MIRVYIYSENRGVRFADQLDMEYERKRGVKNMWPEIQILTSEDCRGSKSGGLSGTQ